MPELSHEEALKHVLHDEIVERLDVIIELLKMQNRTEIFGPQQSSGKPAEVKPAKPLMTHEQAERFASFLRRELERRGIIKPDATSDDPNASQ